MAKIVLSEAAPEGVATFVFGNAEPFDVPFETENRELIANANAHPWLTVEAEEVTEVGGLTFDTRLSAADDHLSALNDHSNEPDVVRAENERRQAEFEERYEGTPEAEVAVVETAPDAPAPQTSFYNEQDNN